MSEAVCQAQALVQRFKTRDPFHIAAELGLKVYFRSDFSELKGFYTLILEQPCIFINANLDEPMQRSVCAHELGHDLLHRRLSALAAFDEFSAFNLKTKPEYEASSFAAALLIDDDELFDLSRQELTIDAIAANMDCQKELIALRMHERNKEARLAGETEPFNLCDQPLGSFLKN